MKIDSKTTIETQGHFENGKLKTKPCDIGEWYGDEICSYLDLDNKIKEIGMPDGEYQIIITLKRIKE